jgi:hypothetical protein
VILNKQEKEQLVVKLYQEGKSIRTPALQVLADRKPGSGGYAYTLSPEYNY